MENIHPCIQDINALQLEYLLEDQHYFIVSPRDMFFGKPRDEDDHLDWLLLQENVSFIFWILHLFEHFLVSVRFLNFLFDHNVQSF